MPLSLRVTKQESYCQPHWRRHNKNVCTPTQNSKGSHSTQSRGTSEWFRGKLGGLMTRSGQTGCRTPQDDSQECHINFRAPFAAAVLIHLSCTCRFNSVTTVSVIALPCPPASPRSSLLPSLALLALCRSSNVANQEQTSLFVTDYKGKSKWADQSSVPLSFKYSSACMVRDRV